MTDEQPPTFDALAALAREQLPVDASADAVGEQRLVRELAQRGAVGSMRPWGLAAAVALMLAVGVAVWPARAPVLSYTVEGSSSAQRAAVDAPADTPATVAFSDGSQAVFAAGSRGRVVAIDGAGAQMKLDAGRVAVHVVERDEPGHWSVRAGRYRVRVTGTRFTVDYAPDTEGFGVVVQRGQVVVERPGGPTLTLNAGERFSTPPTEPIAPTEPAMADDDDDGDARDDTGSAAADGRDRRTTPWPRLVAVGQFERVIELAHARGLARCIKSCSLADLQALSDAARYSQDHGVARRALGALRRRFAGSPAAVSAAFLLGRMAHVAGDERTALRHFDDYLGDASDGTFADEAMGRKLLVVAHRSPARAPALARQYLDRFPTGGHAAHARRIVAAAAQPAP